MRPDDLPSAGELAEGKPHGTRIRYMGGCRCVPCRAANSRYECERQAARRAGDWNGLVPAGRALRHIRSLSRAGVGRRSVAAACDVAETVICEIRAGRKTRIRARTERRILSVTRAAVGGGAVIDARHTWVRIRRLLREGFTKAELARRLGYGSPALQINPSKVTARNAVRVRRFYNLIMEV